MESQEPNTNIDHAKISELPVNYASKDPCFKLVGKQM